MAMTVKYLTVDGEILSETRSGSRSDYIPDPLGSTAALFNSGQTITDTFFWWPFGELRSHVGPNTTPFGYIGTLGYYANSIGVSLYVTTRILRPQTTAWQTNDSFWPVERPFSYCDANPTSRTDQSGEAPQQGPQVCLGPYWTKRGPINWPPTYGKVRTGYPPKTTKPKKSKPKCSAGGQACDDMCDFLSQPWSPIGQPPNFAAQCVACCMETIKLSKDFCKDVACCWSQCTLLAGSHTKPSNTSPYIPCSC